MREVKANISIYLIALLMTAVVGTVSAFYVPVGGQVSRMQFFRLAQGNVPRRIVSLAPVITETLFAIGAGEKVKGVTDYCDYPPEVMKIPKVGGYYDPNFEAILALHPDLVIILPEHREYRQRFQYLHIATYTVEMHSLAGIMSTFIQLGSICQKEAQGIYLAETFRQKTIQIRNITKTLARKKVMLVIGRDYSAQQIREVYIAGKGEFYDELLRVAGGENAYILSTPKYPRLSAEGILALHADCIIELIPEPLQLSRSLDEIQADWTRLPGLEAARKNQIYILTGMYLVRPGPRLLLLLEDLVKILHPEALKG